MGYPKWQNGASQMVFWGMRKWRSGHQNKGAEVEFWGVEGREMGGMRPRKTPKIVQKGEKNNPFLQFSGHGKRHNNQVENMKQTHSKHLIKHYIEH